MRSSLALILLLCLAGCGLLPAVKDAWRNPTMHVRIDYTEEQALDIYGNVRGFMQHLATRLSE